MSKRGTLYFYDAGGKFNSAKHGLTNLLGDNDICVYSLTPKGHSNPAWLIVKVTLADCMDRYLDDKVTDPKKRSVIMEKIEYEKKHPKNLFRVVSNLTYTLRYNTGKNIHAAFYENIGIFIERRNAHDFFSMEVDPESTESGAQIYLRDRAYFVEGRTD